MANEKEKEDIKEYGSCKIGKIEMLSIIGEIEGHDNLSQNTKVTKYEHILPLLAGLEEKEEVEGVLLLVNTIGGDVSCGLALAEMISSMSKTTVALVIGDSHSIGVPLAVAADYSFIVPSATMIIHPVRMSGMVIGAPQTFDQFRLIQDRIVGFISEHSKAAKERLEELMMNTGMLSKDLGTMLVGEEAVEEGLMDEVGGLREAIAKVHEIYEERKNNCAGEKSMVK